MQTLSINQQAQDTLDDARKSASYTAMWLFIALLSDAFFASYMATFGGRQRDSVYSY